MAVDAALLQRTGFDLSVGVFLAQASSVAYWPDDKVRKWTQDAGFSKAVVFDSGNIQGYWCVAEDLAMLAFRGTGNVRQWLRDARFFPVEDEWGSIHIGFRDGVMNVASVLADFGGAVKSCKHVWLTGHSLGGALAVVAAMRLKSGANISPFLYTYGQPAVGLNGFAERFSVELPQRFWRFVNQSDIVTRVPPWPYRHTGAVKRIVRPGVLEAAAMRATKISGTSPAAKRAETLQELTAGGVALESAKAVADSGLAHPQLIELDPVQLSDFEFARLQLALGAAAEPETKGPALEGAIPFIGDHAINEYYGLLKEIRDATSAT
jgi:triacylglycerol lipase